ncbi:PGF-CTERM sorting domain-containing protein, partial [Halorubrum yunnanense]
DEKRSNTLSKLLSEINNVLHKSVTLDAPAGTYTINSEVDLNGTAEGVDSVDVYVRDQGRWQILVSDIEVESDDSFEEEDVVMSDQATVGSDAARILGQVGSYRIGVVDHSAFSGNDDIRTTDFTGATSNSRSIRTVEGNLNAQFGFINGQVNQLDDSVDISGTAEGQSAEGVSLVYVDRRGSVSAETLDVESDGTIDSDDRAIPTGLAEGTVSVHVISPGRDGNFGNAELPNGQSGESGLNNWINQNVSNDNLNGDQARSRILSETTDDTASDDLVVTQTFRYAESQTTIDSVYPQEAQAEGVNPVAAGETMVVEGTTNLRPDDNSINVELLNQDGESFEISSTETWGTDGSWNVAIDTSDIETGSYVVESDDGQNSDRAEVEIVEERQTADDGEDGEDGEDGGTDGEDGGTDGDDGMDGDDGSDGEDGGTDGEDGGTDGEDGGDDGGDGGTDDSTPGFGALVALVALVAAALLATRRDN